MATPCEHIADDRPPAASVIMPVYNGEKYLCEAMSSLLSQTWKDFELLLINDGSTDGSRQIMESYCDARIRILDNGANRGLISTLNRGLEEARGAWIIRADADDISLPERFAAQMDYCRRENADLCFCDMTVLKPDGSREPFIRSNTRWIPKRWAGLFADIYGAHPTACFRHKEILSLGGYDPSAPAAEDYDLWDRCAAKGLRFSYVPQALVIYRVHAASVTAVANATMEASTRRISQRALRRIWPELVDEECDSLRWLFRGLDPPKADGSHALGFRLRGELMRRFFVTIKPSPEECREIWAMVAESLQWRLRRMATWGDRWRGAILWTQAALRARGKYHPPLGRIFTWIFRRLHLGGGKS
ncbi:MAG: glycosyltransferase [Candidatus Sumerlaeota bacterium]|nr:glycosyltransferase [Candidatus Sumerlaeota bacterium]